MPISLKAFRVRKCVRGPALGCISNAEFIQSAQFGNVMKVTECGSHDGGRPHDPEIGVKHRIKVGTLIAARCRLLEQPLTGRLEIGATKTCVESVALQEAE